MTPAIETRDLQKTFGKSRAVRCMACPACRVAP